MQIKRTSKAHWSGTGKEGKGNLSTPSNILNQSPYSFLTRFENEAGTNPEELIAAAHAGCFSMKLAFILSAAQITPDSIDTNCTIVLENGAITKSNIETHVKANGLSAEQFDTMVADAEKNCPISKLLNTKITVVSKLN